MIVLSSWATSGVNKPSWCTGSDHGIVGLGEVVEVADERLDAARHVEGFEHVGANEVVEVVDRLHRHGLVEQIERLLGLEAEPRRKARPYSGKWS